MKRLFLFLIIFIFFLFFENFVLADESSEDQIKKAIVKVMPYKNNKPIKFGNGFVVSPDGWIITNCHMVEDFFKISNNKIIVEFYDKTQCEAVVISCLDPMDVALIKTSCAPKDFRYFHICRNKIEANENIFLINWQKKEKGYVIEIDISEELTLMEISTEIVHGDSGSPILNEKNEVVGVVTSLWRNLAGKPENFFATQLNTVYP